MAHSWGPQSIPHSQRLSIAQEIAEHLWQGINKWAQEHGFNYISSERIPF
jgi:hypothetical protein